MVRFDIARIAEDPYVLSVMVFRCCFFAISTLLFLRLVLAGRGEPVKKSKVAFPRRRLIFGVSVAAIAVLGYQATWQLAGFRDSRFVGFMDLYSRRSAGPARSMSRGRILDCNGLELAVGNANHEGRSYPFGSATSHVVGYQDTTYGNTGIERADDARLRGAELNTDVATLRRFGRNLLNHRLVTGSDTVLTVDARMQVAAMRLFANRGGAAVAIDPRTGAIRMLLSAPAFDPNQLSSSMKAPGSPMYNRALLGLYPPGSTFKIVLAAAALDHGMGGRMACPAEGFAAKPGEKPIRDHEYYEYQRKGRTWKGQGQIDVEEALIRSSNVYFARLGTYLGPDRMGHAVDRFALKESFSLFSGSSGSLESKGCSIPALSPADALGLAQVSIGQGKLLVTPLHMASVVATIANGGKLCRPFLRAGQTPVIMKEAMTAKSARLLTRYMTKVVTRGTGRGARISNVPLAGKTGTAQASSGDDHSWFVAFGPVGDPTLAMAVIVENGGYGSRSALPIVAELFRYALEIGLLDTPVAQEVQP